MLCGRELGGERSLGRDGWVGSVEGKGGSRVKQGFRLEKMGEWNRKGCGHSAAFKRWLLFEGLDQASSDLSGTSDETVEIITNNTSSGANEYTVNIFSS